jgi:hypothetical protein
MSKDKGWDLTSLHSLEGAAEWIRKNAGAEFVLVVRQKDVAIALHPEITPSDALLMVEVAMPEAMARLQEIRLEAKARAKVKKLNPKEMV